MGVGGWFRRKNTALVRRFLADKALLSGIVNLPGCWFAVGGGLEIYPLVLQINSRASTHPTIGYTSRDVATINAARFPVPPILLD
jgi:hypothetical protein